MPRERKQSSRVESYDIERSPFAQKPTQRDIASLVGETRDDLRRLVNYKEHFIVRRQTQANKKGKVRDLAYPVSRLRRVHERLKFHFNKIKQPKYLFSPRKNRGQRDNAALHLDQHQYLTLDLKQFYPSTTENMVWSFYRNSLGMYDDVAGLLTHLCTVDGAVSFGSPFTPVLCTMIHRPMFDEIEAICAERGLRTSLWVDDLTISGRFVPGEVLSRIREVVRASGLKSHRIKYRTGNRPVFITGIGVVGSNLVAPNALHLKTKAAWDDYHQAQTDEEKDSAAKDLLSFLGTLKHIVGPKSQAGQKASDQMNSLRQERDRRSRLAQAAIRKERESYLRVDATETVDLPF